MGEYTCSICNSRYSSRNEADKCEERGFLEISIPSGSVFVFDDSMIETLRRPFAPNAEAIITMLYAPSDLALIVGDLGFIPNPRDQRISHFPLFRARLYHNYTMSKDDDLLGDNMGHTFNTRDQADYCVYPYQLKEISQELFEISQVPLSVFAMLIHDINPNGIVKRGRYFHLLPKKQRLEAELNEAIKDAISEERYEDCIKLREKLKRLKAN